MKIKTIGELKRLIEKLPDDLSILRGDNSGGYETIYEGKIVHDIIDNFPSLVDKVSGIDAFILY